MKRSWMLFALLGVLLLTGCTAGGVYVPPTLTPLAGEIQPTAATGAAATGQKVAIIETPRGTIRCQLRPDVAPQTVANFEKLANQGWYDGRTFFRVVPEFVIQGGSPTNDAGGDIGYTIEAEIGLPHEAGALASARTGDDVNPERRSSGSQFYITLEATPHLDGAYTVFGYCGDSLSVVKQIQANDPMTRVRVEEQ